MSKKQIIQLSVLTLCLYLGVFFLMEGGYEYDSVYLLITLLSLLGIYVIYSQKDSRFIKYLRIFLHVVIVLMAVGLIRDYSFYNFNYPASFPIEHIGYKVFRTLRAIIFDFLPIYMLLIAGVLLLNKPSKVRTLKIGRLKISL